MRKDEETAVVKRGRAADAERRDGRQREDEEMMSGGRRL